MNRQSAVTVESVMSLERPIAISSLVQFSDRQRRASAHEQRWGKPVIQAEPYLPPNPIETWADSKIVAILRCYRSERAKDCLEHLKQSGIDASQIDFLQLRKEGLAFKRELAYFHELTPMGQRYAEKACVLIAQRFGLHHIVTSGDASSAGARCTCGWRCRFGRKYFGEQRNVERAINEHLADPQAWKRDREQIEASAQTMAEQIAMRFNGGGDG